MISNFMANRASDDRRRNVPGPSTTHRSTHARNGRRQSRLAITHSVAISERPHAPEWRLRMPVLSAAESPPIRNSRDHFRGRMNTIGLDAISTESPVYQHRMSSKPATIGSELCCATPLRCCAVTAGNFAGFTSQAGAGERFITRSSRRECPSMRWVGPSHPSRHSRTQDHSTAAGVL